MPKKILYIVGISIFSLSLLLTTSTAEAKIIREETFDTDLNGLHGYGNAPGHSQEPYIQHDIVRYGTGAAYVRLYCVEQAAAHAQFLPNEDPNKPWKWNDPGADWPLTDADGNYLGHWDWNTWLKREFWFGIRIYVPKDFQPLTWTWPDGTKGHGWPDGGSGGELWWQIKTLAPKGWDTWPISMALYLDYGRKGGPGSAFNPVYQFTAWYGSYLAPRDHITISRKFELYVMEDRGHWVDWVWHFKMDPTGEEAFIGMYRRRDDESSFTRLISEEETAGIPNAFEEEGGTMNVSWGPYIWDIYPDTFAEYCEIPYRELYFDDWRVGEGYASVEEALAEISPGGGGVVISPGPAPTISPAPVVRTGIVREELFDGNLDGLYYHGQRPELATDPVCSGTGSIHTRLDISSEQRRSMPHLDSDPDHPWPSTSGSAWLVTIGQEYWFGISVYVPDTWEPLTWNGGDAAPSGDSGGELLWQLEALPDDGETYRSPVMAIYVDYGRKGGPATPQNPYYQIVIRGDDRRDSGPLNSFPYSASEAVRPVLPDRGHWVDWVFHTRFNYVKGGNSFTQVYVRQAGTAWEEVISKSHWAGQPNCSNDQRGPYLQIGVYIWNWADPALRAQSDIDHREWWFDELRIGNSTSSLASVAPSCGIPSVFPPGNGILPAPEPALPPGTFTSVDLRVNGIDGPLTVLAGTSVRLSWVTANATSCTASGGWEGLKGTSGVEQTAPLNSSKIYTLKCSGSSGSHSDSVTVNVFTPTANVSAYLEALPNSGIGSLYDVGLRASVSGTATGPITYRFDCLNDGSWDKTITTDENPYTALNLCDYPAEGTYIALVRVEREGASATDTVNIRVSQPNLVTVTPETQIILGQPEAKIDIDIFNTAGLHAYSFDVFYNSSILSFKSLQRSTFLGSPDDISWTINPRVPEKITVSATRKDDSFVNGSGTLAGITFNVLNTGVSEIRIENLTLYDEHLNETKLGTVKGQIIVRSAPPPGWIKGILPPALRPGGGRLVPCGLSYDDPETPDIYEDCPCTLCHFFPTFRKIVDFIFEIIIVISVLMATIAGILYILARQNMGNLRTAQRILRSVVIGAAIIFSAWLLFYLTAFVLGTAEWTGLKEGLIKIDCPVPGATTDANHDCVLD